MEASPRTPQHQLTISIPTYNRPQQVVQQVQSLLPMIDGRTVIRIIDNASPVNVLEMIRPLIPPALEGQVHLVQNPFNIGGNANILRCVELCQTEWLWILGDDDDVYPDALNTIFEDIALNPDSVFLNYTNRFFPREGSYQTTGFHDLIQRLDAIDTIAFVSSDIFRAPLLQAKLKYGYMYLYSWLPHVALMFSVIGRSGKANFSHRNLIDCEVGRKLGDQKFSIIAYCLGASTILDFAETKEDRSHLAELLFRGSDRLYVLYFHLAVAKLRGLEYTPSRFAGAQVYQRSLRYHPSLIFQAKLTFLRLFLTLWPQGLVSLFLFLGNRIYKRQIGMDDVPRVDVRM